MDTAALKKLVRAINFQQHIYLSKLWQQHHGNGVASTLTPRQATHLMQIRSHLPCNMGKLTVLTGLSSAAASLYVDEMERKHILKRTGSTKDKRNIIITITPEAQENLNEADSKIDMFLEEICSTVTPKQMQEIDRSLQLLCRLMENVDIKSTSTWDCVVNIRNTDVKLNSTSNTTDQIK